MPTRWFVVVLQLKLKLPGRAGLAGLAGWAGLAQLFQFEAEPLELLRRVVVADR